MFKVSHSLEHVGKGTAENIITKEPLFHLDGEDTRLRGVASQGINKGLKILIK